MKKNACMYFRKLYFMYHRFHRMRIKFIDKYCIIVMHIRLDCFVDIVAEEQWLVVEIDFDIHVKYILT